MEKFTKLNETSVMPDIKMFGDLKEYIPSNGEEGNNIAIKSIDPVKATKSEPCKFVSKIFESRQIAHVYHLQTTGEGSFAKHKALDKYYNEILELNDKLIETYQGQYEILEDYEVIESNEKPEEVVQYFIELVEFIKSTRKIAFLEEDTHLQNIIDEMVALIYQTLYKLKNLK
jgi:DNA-binding ferritin-like protein